MDSHDLLASSSPSSSPTSTTSLDALRLSNTTANTTAENNNSNSDYDDTVRESWDRHINKDAASSSNARSLRKASSGGLASSPSSTSLPGGSVSAAGAGSEKAFMKYREDLEATARKIGRKREEALQVRFAPFLYEDMLSLISR